MSTRSIMMALAAIGGGSLLLLFDSVVTSIATAELQMTAERIGQAQFIYVFGAVGAAIGLILVGFLDAAAAPARED